MDAKREVTNRSFAEQRRKRRLCSGKEIMKFVFRNTKIDAWNAVTVSVYADNKIAAWALLAAIVENFSHWELV